MTKGNWGDRMRLRTIPHSLNFVVDEFALSAQDNYGLLSELASFF